jgi:hypothetical protein
MGDVNWIDLAHVAKKWQAVVSTAMNISFPYSGGRGGISWLATKILGSQEGLRSVEFAG